MPFSRIYLHESRTADQRRQISDILHQSLVDEFAVPVDDRFQLITPCSDGHLIYDRHYLTSGPDGRSDGYLLFHITAGKARSREQKQNFYRTLTRRLTDGLAMSPDDVMIVIQFSAAEDWCFASGHPLITEAL
ncbi:tautomerase family protein [Affinibrenneria salicis]|uniref:Tautomerase family protein n=1 Tax=Affinibrenneria salicis TaxID=2590031 RepID=A0A5J5FTL1_9GAMM|nr:tautomerase family protein [Affinibrenneria salicis]KAA8996925.1 tautomerase family protein [Affinibrenneria salicis]